MKVLSLVAFLMLLISCGRNSDVGYTDPGYTTPTPSTTVVYTPGHGGHRPWPSYPRWGGHRPGGHGPSHGGGHGGPRGGHGGGHGGPGGGHHLLPETIVTDKICDQYTGDAYTDCLKGFENSESN